MAVNLPPNPYDYARSAATVAADAARYGVGLLPSRETVSLGARSFAGDTIRSLNLPLLALFGYKAWKKIQQRRSQMAANDEAVAKYNAELDKVRHERQQLEDYLEARRPKPHTF